MTGDKKKGNIRIFLLLAGIILLGLGLRLYGVGFGLPGVYHPDEERLVHHALAFGLGDLNPHYFNYPSFGMYVLFFEYVVYYLLGSVLGIFSSPGQFSASFFADPTVFYLIGRVTSAILSTATIFLIYRLGKKAYSRGAGLIAASLIALCFLHVRSSHFITTDIPLVFFITWAYLEILGIMRTGRLKYYVRAGILAGIGAAFKYNAATLALPIFLAHCFSPYMGENLIKRFFARNIWICGGVMLLAFFLATPYVFLDFPKFWEDFRGISEHMKIGVYGTGGGTHYLEYAKILFRDGIYYAPPRFDPLGFIYLIGVAWAIWRHGRRELVIGIYPLCYFLLIGSWGVCNARYFLPIFPGLAVLAGGAGAWLWSVCFGRKVLRALLVSFFLLALLPALQNIVLHDRMLAVTDTRTQAREWIEENLPADTVIALEWDNNATVPLQESNRLIREKIRGYREGELSTVHHHARQMQEVHERRLAAARGKGYELVRLGEVNGLTLVPDNYDFSALSSLGVEYLVLSQAVYGWFFKDKIRQKYPVHTQFYDKVLQQWEPLQIFRNDSPGGPFPGPEIRIYRFQQELGGPD